MAEVNEIQIAPISRRFLGIPEHYDVFLGGGRGGLKTENAKLGFVRHAAKYGALAKMLALRQTRPALRDLEHRLIVDFGTYYQGEAKYNSTDGIWRLPGGATLELGHLETIADYNRYQGRAFTLIFVDEAGQYTSPQLLDLMRSNLRAPKGIPLRMQIAANPGGPGHSWIAKRFVFGHEAWAPFVEPLSKRTWVYAPATFLDNPFIDQSAYRAQLESSAPADKELLRAWLEGDWAIARGAYFADCLDESRVAVGPFRKVPMYDGKPWHTYLAHDFGSSAPSVTYLLAQSPGATWDGKFYPRDSVVAIDEYATVVDLDNLNAGLGWTASIIGEAIVDWCKQWRVSPRGVADDSVFAKTGHSAGSIAREFGRVGVTFRPAQKGDRISGWQKMRRMFADAGKPDVPGLYVSRSCAYFWATVPFLVRDPKRIEDLDSKGPDHAADALRYGLKYQAPVMKLDGIGVAR